MEDLSFWHGINFILIILVVAYFEKKNDTQEVLRMKRARKLRRDMQDLFRLFKLLKEDDKIDWINRKIITRKESLEETTMLDGFYEGWQNDEYYNERYESRLDK